MSKSDCGSECMSLSVVDNKTGHRLMKANQGNSKFSPGTEHPQCDDCLTDMLERGKLEALGLSKEEIERDMQLKYKLKKETK